MNYLWLGLILCGVLLGVCTGRTEAVTIATFEACKTSLMSIALPLGALMAFWLGIMRLAEKSGAVEKLAAFFAPRSKKTFPRCSSGSSGHGCHGDEYGRQHARPR
ncbi:MAG: hypothetical protein WCP41_00670 [Verrucomicrobiota bacterium]